MKKSILGLATCLAILFGIANSLTYTLEPKSEPLSVVSDKFLSITLDTGMLLSANLTNKYFSRMVGYLTPVYLRVGGTTADTVLFVDDTKGEIYTNYKDDNLIITASFWLQLTEFAKASNTRLIFDLNSLRRNDDGSWDSENAEALIKFSYDNNIELDWELGNEPDLYHSIFKTSVNASQLAQDYLTLRSILNKYDLYNSSLLIGPSQFDAGSGDDTKAYLTEFVSEASSAIDAVTWHQYYFFGWDAKEELFLQPATFNYLKNRASVVKEIAGPSRKVWLSETSSCNNQGVANMSNKYLASFLWLDKLGYGAQLGLDVIIRQTIWGYNYPLLDVDFTPNPDYYISYIYKNTIGPEVLALNHDGDDDRPIRLYAHCAPESQLWGDHAITIFGVNIVDTEQTFTFDGLGVDIFDGGRYYAYIYAITADNLYSKTIRLSDEPLIIGEDFVLPKIEPTTFDLVSYNYTMPPYSSIFMVIPNSGVEACQK